MPQGISTGTWFINSKRVSRQELALLLPSLAVAARRLHDTDRSAWWLLLGLIPIIGTLVLIYFMVCNGQQGPNRFGDDPKGAPSQGFIVS
ncbi:MAG: DUF805 domain-containing protein [Aeromonas sp.]|uniref:DUF805 domain-containing protein n=1 Tax=Aeromonas sp. TaxID=647 RepID=UPI003D6B126F